MSAAPGRARQIARRRSAGLRGMGRSWRRACHIADCLLEQKENISNGADHTHIVGTSDEARRGSGREGGGGVGKGAANPGEFLRDRRGRRGLWRSTMAGSVNKVILVGNLGKDPEVRRMQNGNPVVNLSVATSDSWRDKATGERKEKTEWHRVVIFSEGLAKVAEQYLKKGAKVYIEGALQTRKWTDKDGVEKYSTEIVLQGFNSTLTMLDGARGAAGAGGGSDFGADQSSDFGSSGPARARQPAMAGGGGKRGDIDDEVPFEGIVARAALIARPW